MGKKVFPLIGPAIFESLNRLNSLTLTEDEFTLEDFQMDSVPGYNASCRLVAKDGGDYRGDVELRYNRLSLDSAKLWLYDGVGDSAVMVLVSEKHPTTKAMMKDFNLMTGMNVPVDDVVDEPIDWSSPDAPLITLKTNPLTATTFSGEIRCRLLLRTRRRVEVVLDIDAIGVDGTFFTTTTPPEEITIDWDDGRGPGQNFQVYAQGAINYIGIKSNTNDLLGIRTAVIQGARGVRFTEVAPSLIKVIELVEYSTDDTVIQPLFLNTFNSLTIVHPGVFQRCTGVTSVNSIFKGQTKITEYPSHLFAWMPFLSDIRQAFQGNSSLLTTPEYLVRGTVVRFGDNLFDGCIKLHTAKATTLAEAKTLQTATYLLANCTELTTVEAGFFSGLTTLQTLTYGFYRCPKITRYPDRLLADCPVTNAGWLFAENVALTSPGFRPFGDTPQLVIANRIFQANVSMTVIDEDLFYGCGRLGQLEYGFSGTSIEAIPANLFRDTLALSTLLHAFSYCQLKSLPNGLFSRLTRATTFDSCFYLNKNLAAIPADLFGNNSSCLYIRNMFAMCYDLEEIPETLLHGLPSLISATSLFYALNPNGPERSKIRALPVDLFRYNTRLGSIDGAFAGLVAVTHIPGGMFTSFTSAYTESGLTSLFQGMSGVITMDENVLEGLNPTATTGAFQLGNRATRASCFSGMSSLLVIPEKILSYVPRVNAIPYLFRGCGAAEIPADILKQGNRITDPMGMFSDMPNLRQLPPTLFTGLSGLQQTQRMFENTSITSVPTGFLNGLTYLNINMTGMFSKCADLSVNINDIFNLSVGSYSHVGDVSEIFYQSPKVTGDALVWRQKFPHIADNGSGGTRAVSGCPLLENINSVPYTWRMP